MTVTKTDMVKGKISVLLIVVGIVSIFATLGFMYLISGYSNIINLTAAMDIMIGQIFILLVGVGAITVANLWFAFFNIANSLALKRDMIAVRELLIKVAQRQIGDEEKK